MNGWKNGKFSTELNVLGEFSTELAPVFHRIPLGGDGLVVCQEVFCGLKTPK